MYDDHICYYKNDFSAEILILSSDEEEESKPKKTELPRLVPRVLSKEPDYSQFSKMSVEEMCKAVGETKLNDILMDNLQPGQYTTITCRSIRIGSYKTMPTDRVLISTEGIKFVVPSFSNGKEQ